MKPDAQYPDGTVLKAQVCIVGTGAAGLTAALELIDKRRDVVLLEAGTDVVTTESQDAYRGTFGIEHHSGLKSYLTAGRLRFFGGSTNHWAGWCRPLDPEDFAPHAHVPLSGWPIARAELEPWYAKARGKVEIKPFIDDDEALARAALPTLDLHPDIRTRLFHFSPPTRFADRFGPRLERSAYARTLLDATVTELVRADGRITGVRGRSGDGRTFSVEADIVILACGGIENSRVLLNNGLGGAMVGRCFMDHPHQWQQARMWMTGPLLAGEDPLKLYLQRTKHPLSHSRAMGVFCLTPERRQREQLQHAFLHLRLPKKPWAKVPILSTSVARLAQHSSHDPRVEPLQIECFVVGEQAPNPDSRVQLIDELDRYGVPRVRLDWALQDCDARSLARTAEIVTDALAAAHMGRARLRIHPDAPWREIRGGYHQMGGTRMGTDPATSVVDANCQLHDIANLYVAGGSVFPTSGYANPTLTVTALAARLAAHIQQKLLTRVEL